jgi:hypothetical protein
MVVAEGDLLFATVNLPAAAVLVSTDAGRRWHYRHLFLPGHNVDRGVLLRGVDYRDGLLAVASRDGLLLSRDHGRSFRTALAGEPLWAVAISPLDPDLLVAGGEGSSHLSRDGGETWSDLRFSAFVGTLASRNPHRIDHITSLEFDPVSSARVYVGTGSHVYRLRLDEAATGGLASWQAMEGSAGARVLDDSTVYNIEVGSRLMISTCNGVYWAERLGEDPRPQQAEVSWRKFRDPAFSKRSVGGPKGNLRSYFVAEDPADRGRVLVADFAALYEGRRAEAGGMSWRRVEELPYYSPASGYPEYTAIVWPADGAAVVGSRYRGIFVQPPVPPRPATGGGASCRLR